MESRIDEADLLEYPNQIKTHEADSLVTIGDLDGSAVKFTYYLIREGIVTFPPEQYQRLLDLYQKPTADLTRSDIEDFADILSYMQKGDTPLKLRIIGDDLADRGMNDYFILKIYQRLDQLTIPHDVLISNHGFEFLFQYAHGLDQENQTLYGSKPEFNKFGASLINLQTLLKKGVVDIKEVNELVQKHYLDKVHLCHIEPGPDNSELLYTHAPVTPGKMRAVAKLFKVPDTGHLEKLAQRVDRRFCGFIKSKCAHIIELHDYLVMNKFVNDRYRDLEEDGKPFPSSPIVFNIHGHVGETAQTEYVPTGWTFINTDLGIGKENKEKGHYKTHVTPFIARKTAKTHHSRSRDTLHGKASSASSAQESEKEAPQERPKNDSP